jgi:multiple sugar transport system permease protein
MSVQALKLNRKKIKFTRVMLWVLIVILLFFALFPIYWIVITSFKTNNAVIQRVQTWVPIPFTTMQYKAIFARATFWSSLKNSILTSLFATLISLVVSLLLAYAVSRTQMKGKRVILGFVLFTYLLPIFLLFIPIYCVMAKIGLANNILSLYIIYPVTCIPYATWVFVTYLRSIPFSLEEAAMIDGCSKMGIIIRIVVPLALPGIMSIGIFCFTRVWNEFLLAFSLLSDPKQFTLMITIKDYMVGDMFAWGKVFATSVCASVPVMVLYFLSSKWIVSGMTLGSVKE